MLKWVKFPYVSRVSTNYIAHMAGCRVLDIYLAVYQAQNTIYAITEGLFAHSWASGRSDSVKG